MEDGLTLMSFWHKTDTWSVKSALHTWVKQKEINAKITKNANQLLKFNNLTSLVEVGDQQLRKKWWKKFLETEPSMEISKHRLCLVFTKKVFSEKRDYSIYTNRVKTLFLKWLDLVKLAQMKTKQNLNLNLKNKI